MIVPVPRVTVVMYTAKPPASFSDGKLPIRGPQKLIVEA